MQHMVLALDMGGLPQAWLDVEQAIFYYAKNLVAWSLGEPVCVYHGGISRKTGLRSVIAPSSIIAILGSDHGVRLLNQQPVLSNDTLFVRDRHVCAYCGEQYKTRDLSREHVIPLSRKGKDSWTNTVTACRPCNNKKGNKTPEEAHMPLLYVPYVPNRHEYFILQNRNILADQMEYLIASVPRNSRLHS